MTVKEMMEKLSKFPRDARCFVEFDEMDGTFYLEARKVFVGYFADSEQIYHDTDDAIEAEQDDWGGELEEVVLVSG